MPRSGASQTADHRKSERRVPLAALFIAFLKVSLGGFSGGLFWARRITVEQRGWISEPEFADIVSLCQFMPGPNMVGIAVCTGAKLRGSIGAIAAACGFVLIPGIVGFMLGVLCLQYAHLAVLQNILRGVAAAGAGLLIATGIRMLAPHRSRPAAMLIAALALAGMALADLPLLVVLLGLVPLSIGFSVIASARAR